jgi:NAD(P)-dependent dehydrogenase (short-subunit alcohol dehydrogenase family)
MSAAGFVPATIVLNAGISNHDADDEFRPDVSRQVLSTNLHGALAFIGPFVERFAATGGQFVAVSSIFALRPDPMGIGYAASKAGLTMAFRSLAVRYRRTRAQFKTILLGPITTPSTSGRAEHKRFAPHLRSPEQAARAILSTMRGSRSIVCFPTIVAIAMRATAWLPDSTFHSLSSPLRR